MLEKFTALYPVVKDLSSIRTKGTMQEDIIDYICKNEVTTLIETKHHDISPGLQFNERIEKINDYGIYSFAGSAGIPTFKVGCANKEAWISLREELRTHNLVR